jgi:ATP-binding cassette subfamily G (WHITE) protein 2
MRCLSRLAQSGKTLIYSIHQPRSNIFQTFDLITLLTDSGQMAYFGPAKKSMDFVQAGCGLKVEPYVNPADYLLDLVCTTPADGDDDQRLDGIGMGQHMASTYRGSEWAIATEKTINEILADLKRNQYEAPMPRRSTGRFMQFWVVASRAMKNNLRNPLKTLVMISISVFFALLIGSIYYQVSNNVNPGIQNRAGVLFFLAMNGAFSNLGSLELFLEGRNIFVRERAAGMYKASSYFVGTVLMDLPLPLLYCSIFTGIAYWMIGLQANWHCFFWYIVISYVINMCSYSLCLFVSCFAPSFAIANLIAPLVIVMFLLPSGFLVNIADLPVYWRWLKYVSFFRYGFEALMINEFSGLELTTNPSKFAPHRPGKPVMGDDILEERFNFDPSGFYADLGICAGQAMLYLFFAFLCLTFLQKETR